MSVEDKHESLEKYLWGASAAERADVLCKLMGWFRSQPDAEFWTALEQMTLAERAADEVSRPER